MPYYENVHFEKRLEAIEKALKEVFDWSEEDIEKNRSKYYEDRNSAEEYVDYINQFHDIYRYLCFALTQVKPENTDKLDMTLEILLMHLRTCWRIFPKPWK